MLEAVLRAFGPEQQGRAADDDYPRQQPRAAAAVGGVKAAGAATADGSLGQGRMAAEDLVAREAELRDEFLRQVTWQRMDERRQTVGDGVLFCVVVLLYAVRARLGGVMTLPLLDFIVKRRCHDGCTTGRG